MKRDLFSRKKNVLILNFIETKVKNVEIDFFPFFRLSFSTAYRGGSMKTSSNYEAIKRRKSSNKRHLYNKSLDHVFKTRYQAISQNPKNGQALQKNSRVKLIDVFQQQQMANAQNRRPSSALTTADPTTTSNNKKQRKKSSERHLEHL